MATPLATSHLFVYGSLRDSMIFKSVCGFRFTRNKLRIDKKILFAEPAFLSGYKRVSPDNVYYYAVAAPTSRIEGLLIHAVPEEALTEIDHYEGRFYIRETVDVHTASGMMTAQAYLVSHESMRKHFGDRFHVNLIHELWLRKRIGRFINKHTRPGDRTTDARMERLAERELLATTERDLVMSYYGAESISDYYLAHELDKPRPSICHLYDDPEARPFIQNYLALVVRQVLLNQLDERIQMEYRFELEHMRSSERYYKRSVSLLTALYIINASADAVRLIMDECIKTMPYQQYDLFDYVKYAVKAARTLFDPRIAKAHLERIHANLQTGLVPLGCEIELSNLGYAAVEPLLSENNAFDPVYNGFKYFNDFHLDMLFWKLGGYIDDHRGSVGRDQRYGFLELAPGRLNIAGELSRPATADPWLLNQLIHDIMLFYDIKPHSLHLSFQLRKHHIGHQKVLPLEFVKCLLVLGGGAELSDTGHLLFSRMNHDEITQFNRGEELMFARVGKRNWYLGTDEIADKSPTQATTYVQQYKFIRLEQNANYEALILCLKGLQLSYNPGDYLTVEQLKTRPELQEDYHQLKAWSRHPTPLSEETISTFLSTIHQGLSHEAHQRPAHKPHYIEWAVNAVDTQLRMFNQQLQRATD